MTDERYYVDWEDGLATDCACPDQLCKHPDGIRYYGAWVIVDRTINQMAPWTDHYDRKRDALADCAAANREGRDD